MRRLKKVLVVSMLAAMSAIVWGCGAVEKEEPDVPTKYIKEADDAVDQYNENVDKLNQTGDSVEKAEQE